jgi:hypothetical protein
VEWQHGPHPPHSWAGVQQLSSKDSRQIVAGVQAASVREVSLCLRRLESVGVGRSGPRHRGRNRERGGLGATASLIPFAKVADLLKEVLPVGDSVHGETVRKHMQAMAERIEQELGEERQLNQYEGSENEWEQQPLPDGPITVGIDGGYVRAAHKQGCFEVIAGKSVVAFPARG